MNKIQKISNDVHCCLCQYEMHYDVESFLGWEYEFRNEKEFVLVVLLDLNYICTYYSLTSL